MVLSNKTLSAVIACYLDAQAIPIMYERLTKIFKKLECPYEIIFVNDGSPDNSEQVLRVLASKDSRVTVITHSRNFGSQAAFSSGIMQAIGDAIILLDGDLQDPPEVIEEFVKKWQEGFDVVYGIRHKRETSKFLRIAYKAFYRIFQKLAYIPIPLDAGDFSLMNRNVVNALNSLPERDRFIRGLRAWVGFKQTGIPYKREERKFGKSTNNLIRNIRWAKKGIFSFSYLPLEFISYLAAFIVALSALGIFFYILAYFLFPNSPRGITTIIVLILFLGGIQLLSLSIIGEYLGRIFEETKRRSKYIIKEILNNHKREGGEKDPGSEKEL